MHKKYNKFLVISFVGVFILGVYSYFYNDFIGEVSSAENSLTSSLETNVPTGTGSVTSENVSVNTSFIMDLATLTRIKVDSTIFKDQAFKLLVDNSIPLGEAPYGRINPFSPADKNAKISFILKSIPATSVTSNSAILNGSFEGSAPNNIYFEYGVSETLGNKTPKLAASSVGNFASMLSGLNSKTTYYYRSVASINGNIVYGELISFKTN